MTPHGRPKVRLTALLSTAVHGMVAKRWTMLFKGLVHHIQDPDFQSDVIIAGDILASLHDLPCVRISPLNMSLTNSLNRVTLA